MVRTDLLEKKSKRKIIVEKMLEGKSPKEILKEMRTEMRERVNLTYIRKTISEARTYYRIFKELGLIRNR